LQSRREIRRLAHYTTLLGFAGTDQIAYDDETCGNTDTDRQSAAGRSRHWPRGRHNLQTGANRSLGVVLMRPRVAEVCQNPVAHILGHESIETPDHRRNVFVVLAEHLAQVFRVKPRRNRGRADEVAEHDSETPTFGTG
jgi:hypothetical protein